MRELGDNDGQKRMEDVTPISDGDLTPEEQLYKLVASGRFFPVKAVGPVDYPYAQMDQNLAGKIPFKWHQGIAEFALSFAYLPYDATSIKLKFDVLTADNILEINKAIFWLWEQLGNPKDFDHEPKEPVVPPSGQEPEAPLVPSPPKDEDKPQADTRNAPLRWLMEWEEALLKFKELGPYSSETTSTTRALLLGAGSMLFLMG